MSTEVSKDLARRFYDVALNNRDFDILDELARQDYIEHDPLPGQTIGLEGLKQRATMLQQALDARYTIEDIIAEGDKVVVRWTSSGRHVADFLGIPATGKRFTIAGIDIYRVEGGKLAEHWHVVDQLTMLQQLGVFPTSGREE